MVLIELRPKLLNLRDQVWQLAKESLDASDSKIYDALVDIAKRLSALATSPGDQPPILPNLIAVFANYKGQRYEAQLDRGRVSGGRGHCVFFRGEWMTPSRAAIKISNTSVNGWRFWRYKRANGTVSKIDDLKQSG